MESEGKDVIPNRPGAQDGKATGCSPAGEPAGGILAPVRAGLTKGPSVQHKLTTGTLSCVLSAD